MSHFFTKNKQTDLQGLADSIDISSLGGIAAGQTLKAVDTGGGVIKLRPGVDSSGSDFSLPAGTAGQFLTLVDDGAGSTTPGFQDFPAIPSSLSDFLTPPGAGDYRIVYDHATTSWVLKAAFPDATEANQGSILVSSATVDGDGTITETYWQDTSIPALSFLADPASLAEGDILKVSGGAWVVAPDASGASLPSGSGDGDVLLWDSTAGSWLPYDNSTIQPPNGSADGDLLVWRTAPDRSLTYTEAVGVGQDNFQIKWKSETARYAAGRPIKVRFIMDSSKSNNARESAWIEDGLDYFIFEIRANWNHDHSSGMPQANIDDNITAEIAADGNASQYIETVGAHELNAGHLGLSLTGSGIVNGSFGEIVLEGPVGWIPQAHADHGEDTLVEGTAIVRLQGADLNLGGGTNHILTSADTDATKNKVVVVVDDFAGDAILVLKDGSVGQHVYINNNSDQARAIKVRIEGGEGSLNGLDGAVSDVTIPPRGTGHFLCIDDTSGDGEWITL